MARRDDSVPSGEIETIIGAGTTFRGDLAFSGQVRLDGVVEGSVRSNGDDTSQLVIGPRGRVTGDVDVSHVVNGGTIDGSLVARKTLKITADGKVSGTASYGALEVMVGGLIDGEIRPDAASSKPGIVRKAATS